jgi:hypothetical protein
MIFLAPHQMLPNQDISNDLRVQADTLFSNLNESIEKIKSQIDSINKNIDDLHGKLTASIAKNE